MTGKDERYYLRVLLTRSAPLRISQWLIMIRRIRSSQILSGLVVKPRKWQRKVYEYLDRAIGQFQELLKKVEIDRMN